MRLLAKGVIVQEQIPGKILLKIARLQTLIVKSREDTRIPSYEIINQIAQATEVDFLTANANALAISEDSTYRVMMLERLITEIVRENFPKESGQFGCNYFAHPESVLVRVPVQRQRFLD